MFRLYIVLSLENDFNFLIYNSLYFPKFADTDYALIAYRFYSEHSLCMELDADAPNNMSHF